MGSVEDIIVIMHLPFVQAFKILGMGVGNGASLKVDRWARIDVRVERGDGGILDWEGKVHKVRVLTAEC